MTALFSKDEPLKTSYPHVGFLILKVLRQRGTKRTSIYDIAERLRTEGVRHNRQLIFGLLFLYSTGLIVFNPPYVDLANASTD
jgi:methylase of polypeptide subunit release factors